jgi:hypothetical protein
MMIGRKLAVDELHIVEPVLPLDNIDANFASRISKSTQFNTRPQKSAPKVSITAV